jgi:hypothetical protein
MLLSLILIVLIGGIAYVHYLQGFFSATLSAVGAILAAVLAFGYHETIVNMLLAGRAADYAEALVLVALFAALYTIFRVVADAFIPGNIHVPLMVDKVGAAVMGLVAALFCVGVLAVAAQQLPFGPSIAGYARMAVEDSRAVTVVLPGMPRAEDVYVHNELRESQIDTTKQQGLLIPVDDMLIGAVNKLSDGALAGARPLGSVHPDYLLELFGQRVGIQPGAKRIAYNGGTAGEAISLSGVFRLREAPQVQGELKQLKDYGLPATVKVAGDDELLLVFRLNINGDAAGDEKDKKFRFSLGSIRLNTFDQNNRPKNFWPIGTVEDGAVIFGSKPDDFLVKPANKQGFDVVFRVPAADVVQDVNALPTGGAKFVDNSFLEVKRMARIDLTGQEIKNTPPPPSPTIGLQWKQTVLETKPRTGGAARAGTGTSGVAPSAAAELPLTLRGQPVVSDQLFTKINVGTGDRDNASVQFTGGTAALKERKLAAFNVDGSIATQRLAAGEYAVQQLAAPAGRKIVQITADPKRETPWQWGDVGKFELEDSAGGKHKPVGAWAKVVVGTAQHFLGAYDAAKGVTDIPEIDGRPTEVTLAFAVPPGVTLTTLKFNGQAVGTVNFAVP